MIASLAGSFVAMSCLGCAPAGDADDVIHIELNPNPTGPAFYQSDQYDPVFPTTTGREFRLPLKVGNDFSASNWADNEQAGRFKALDLSTPMAVRAQAGDLWSAEVSFGASAERTGLGLDLEFSPRAQIQRDRAGQNVARAGAEVRLGQNLTDRDQRGTRAPAPSWYFFVGADNEALVWNVADKQSLEGVALRDQVTVGDLQAGVAWTTGFGSQMSLGLVERELKFTDRTGDRDVRETEHFAAFSFTLKR